MASINNRIDTETGRNCTSSAPTRAPQERLERDLSDASGSGSTSAWSGCAACILRRSVSRGDGDQGGVSRAGGVKGSAPAFVYPHAPDCQEKARGV